MGTHLGAFDYDEAFSRNLGWVTEDEQKVLQAKRVAIAGVGGVGGIHLLTLTRLGIAHFNISDLDIFEQGNFNRQAGAYMQNVGRPKVEVMAEMARGINPAMDITMFPEGINHDNIDAFLDGVDLYIDGLDFFVLDIRRAVFAACAEKGIPAITAAPLGMGTALLCFMPGKMTFEEYFRMEGHEEDERQLRFLLGLSPSMLQMGYLVDEKRIDLEAQKGPSTPMACELCAGIAATNSLKALLNRGDVVAAPWGLHFDAYKNKLKKTWRPGGNDNPIQKIALKIARKQLMKKRAQQTTEGSENLGPEISRDMDPALLRILELARWAPSGDNTQVWEFEVLEHNRFVIHGSDTRDWCVYDLDGHASQIALGTLLETIDVAASAEGMTAEFNLRPDSDERLPVIDVTLQKNAQILPSQWLPYVKVRTTQRRPFSSRNLTPSQKNQLEQAVGEQYQLVWIEGGKARWAMAKLLFRSARIRLTIKEAYDVHTRVIEWNSRYSEDRIPDQAVGLGTVPLKLMRWSLQSWSRVEFLNKFMAGTWLPRLQLDLMTGWFCGAHFMLMAKTPLSTLEDRLDGGRALQRLWLEATRLGLQFQPEMTPLIFTQYSRGKKQFSSRDEAMGEAAEIAADLEQQVAPDVATRGVFMGRLGWGQAPVARSIRKPLRRLLKSS
ncbi:thiamine biosynthesis protein ThiF [Aestuariicella hydrocarbonica]|uniref:Thiamine biosynthesis protein ThiF n=1 Tax=Pseudomaricurvus hydrocarbonicus TaxID=1470433 RepID=A0A9E5MGI5_9GAMM|nr:ThiF family adenylyltransferase [Aestuariicella hydrocarbonica]NHO64716.1 thiamine biosynthesis protein ThiF [Aestuariicella hydrocarbonica]